MKTQEKSSQGMLRSAAVPTELPVQDPLTDRKGLLDLLRNGHIKSYRSTLTARDPRKV